MAVPYKEITDELVSIGQRTGIFDSVNAHEPKNAPGKGLHLSVFYWNKRPARTSGLNRTSVVARWMMQLECDMLREPADSIDIDLGEASDAVWAAVSENFQLDISGVRGVDLLGSEGDPLSDEAGYVTRESGRKYRIIGILVPIIINDVFDQSA